QVKCSHGATSGQISEEEIFYLRARGIEPRRARQMISQGFLNEVVERLDGVELREAIEHRFEERFSILA
ncbi:MAG: SufD family Fe-S cluster assembly protein, partial [Verrucomicrobiae bacterium]|nr:SufD family Fe-S cluster assembly protein [Verrucomicrobiae bacterium]